MKLFVSLLALVLTLPLAAHAKFNAGDTAPDFEARNLNDESTRLSASKGGPILLELGATWCPSCKEQVHQIDKIRDFLKKHNITYISVFLADAPDSIKSYLKEEKIAPPDRILVDSGEARNRYLVLSIPRVILIDSQFRIVFDEMILDAEQLRTRISKELPH